jgi:hypothetical protein
MSGLWLPNARLADTWPDDGLHRYHDAAFCATGVHHALQELQPLVLRQEVREGSWRAAAATEEHLAALRLLQVSACVWTCACCSSQQNAMEAMCT